MTKKIRICAVVVWYNPTDSDYNNINSYIESVDKCLIIDNSPKNHEEKIIEKLPKCRSKIIYNKQTKNIGLCAALNKALIFARKEGYNWILTMDSDSSFINDIIGVYKTFINNTEDSKILLLAPQHKHERNQVKKKKYYKKKLWTMSSGCLVSVENALKIGGYKEELFLDGLDCEICIRGNKMGYSVIECGEAILSHNPAETHVVKIKNRVILKYGYAEPQRYYYQIRSCMWIFRKYHTLNMLKIMIMKLLKIILLFDNKKAYMKAYYRGIKDSFEI